MSRWSRQLVVLVVCATGCVRVESRIRYERSLERTRRSVETIEDSLVVLASRPEVHGTTLQLRLESRERCQETKTPVYRKHAYEERFVAPYSSLRPGYAFALGALGIGIGGYTYLDADRLAATDTSAERLLPEEYRNVGITLAAIGAAFVAIGIVDSLRLRDRDWDAGVEDGKPASREGICHREPLAETQIVANVGSWSHRTTSDQRGEVTIAFETLPEEAFSGSSLTILLGNDVDPTEITLDADATAALLLALASEPKSQISHSREVRAQRACIEAVAAAREARVDIDTDRSAVDAAVESWREARTTCGRRWTPAQEADARAFEAELAATATARATRQCTSAAADARQALRSDERVFDDDDEAGEDDRLARDVGEIRGALATACEGATNASAVLAAFDRNVQDRKRRDLARRRLYEAAGRVDRYLAASDAVGVWTTIQQHPALGPLVRDSPGVKRQLVRVATHWVAALERDQTSRSTQRQVCAARRLVTSYVGSAAWSSLRIAAVKRSSVTNGTKLARLLDGGACR